VQGMRDVSRLTEKGKEGKQTLYTKTEQLMTSGNPKRSDEVLTITVALVQLQHDFDLPPSSQSHPTKHFELPWAGCWGGWCGWVALPQAEIAAWNPTLTTPTLPSTPRSCHLHPD